MARVQVFTDLFVGKKQNHFFKLCMWNGEILTKLGTGVKC